MSLFLDTGSYKARAAFFGKKRSKPNRKLVNKRDLNDKYAKLEEKTIEEIVYFHWSANKSVIMFLKNPGIDDGTLIPEEYIREYRRVFRNQ